MKIAHVVPRSLDFAYGGVAAYLRNIIPEQVNQGHEVRVITNKRYRQFGEPGPGIAGLLGDDL